MLIFGPGLKGFGRLELDAEQADDAMLLRVLSINYESLLNIIHGKRVMS